MKKHFSIVVVVILVCIGLIAACAPVQPAASESAEQQASSEPAESQVSSEPAKIWKVALSNSFVGNDWRQEMQKIVDYVAKTDAYKDRVELTIVNCENTAEAQAASIDALILEGYDAILVDASSPTGLNESIKRAVEQGIVIISFDQLVDSQDVYLLGPDYGKAAAFQAKYLAEALNGVGKVVVDRGLPGAKGSGPLYEEVIKVFQEYPGIEVVHEFDGKFAEGETLAGMNAAIAANPQIDGVYTQGYILPIVKALQEAGRPLVPVTGWSYNSSFLALVENNCDGFICHGSPGISAAALKMALDILEGSTEYTKGVYIEYPLELFAMNPDTVDLGQPVTKIELGVNAFPDMAPGFQMPTVLPDVGVTVPNEAVISE